MKRFRTCSLDQPLLLPPSLHDWLPENHLARFLASLSDALDLDPIIAYYARKDGRGQAAYHPLLMVRLLLYGYMVGIRSSRRLEKATYDDVAFRYLAADQHPDHDSIAEFRRVHLDALGGLFLQALRLCQKAGLVKVGQIALDGTKVAANASRHQSKRYERLSEMERAMLEEVQRLMQEAEATDRQEDDLFGKGRRGDELPGELATAAGQLRKIQAAKQELEREAREKAEQAAREKAEQDGKPKDEAQKKRWQRAKSAEPETDAPGNLTDPESRLMVDGASKAFVQAYNAQVVAAGVPQIIVAQTVVTERNDRRQLNPLLDLVDQNLRQKAELVLADSGYWNEVEIVRAQGQQLDLLVPPDRGPNKQGQLPGNAPQGPAAQQMRQRLSDPEQLQRYRKRSGIVEPVFGMIKDALGYRRFLLRGLRKAQGEWALICTAVNLLKLYRYAPTGT
jgi:transposase